MNERQQRVSQLSLEQRALLEKRLLARTVASPKSSESEPGNDRPFPDANEPPNTEDNSPKALSFGQEGLWFIQQLAPATAAYNVPQVFRLLGNLQRQALDAALQRLVQRHHPLRTKLVLENGTPLQVLHPRTFHLDLTDVSALAPTERAAQLQILIKEEATRPFALIGDFLFRARLIRVQPEEHLLSLTLHHSVSDFASLEILVEELGLLYTAVVENRGCELPPLTFQFADWAAKQRHRTDSGALNADLEYWRKQLAGTAPCLNLPIDRPRPGTSSFRGSRQRLRLDHGLTDRLRRLAAQEGVTLYCLLLAALETLLHRYSGDDDVCIASPVAQRHEPGTERLVGLLLNTVIVRANLSGNPSFRDLLASTRATVAGAFAHQEIPFESLVEKLGLSNEGGTNPLCHVMFQYLPKTWPTPKFKGITSEPIQVETGTAKFDLTLTVMESTHPSRDLPSAAPSALDCELEYNSDLFDGTSVARMLSSYQILLQGIAANPAERIGCLEVLTPEEKRRLLIEWNQTESAYPRMSCIHQVFEGQAEATPTEVAVIDQNQVLSYAQLNAQANQLARHLVQLGVATQARVGVCLERSVEMIVSLLAILKAGAVYVPLDPNYPSDRLAHMLADAQVSLVLTSNAGEQVLSSLAKKEADVRSPHPASTPKAPILIRIDMRRPQIARESTDNVRHPATAEDLAYIMYTSGSTGQCKGVAVPHRGVVRLVKGASYASFGAKEVFLQFAPLSFDASTFEIWGPLLNGAKLVLYPPRFESLEQFASIVQGYGVTTLWLTAGLFHQLVETHLDSLRGVRQLLAGGDVLPVPQVLKVLCQLPGCQLINGYGPTENTTFTCCYRFPSTWDGTRPAPIGRPISNTQVYLLDRYLNPVPVGVAGELCVAGDGLARGYWNSPALTSERFISNPFATEADSAREAKLYRTGDQARYLADGTIEFLGRSDDQVKVNGFRIHLQEVEAALEKIDEVRQAIVLTRLDDQGTKQLNAYVVLKNPGSIQVGALREKLHHLLPHFMVPAHILLVESLPLTANGKVDRKRLPAIASNKPLANDSEKLHGATAIQMLQIWKECFRRERLEVDDSFFDLGGHSLLATRLISRINQAFGSTLTLATLFRFPTIRALSEQLATMPAADAPGPIKPRARLRVA